MPAFSQDPVWHEGVLVLSNHEILRGKLSVECHHDLVLFRAASVQVYPAHRLTRVYFYDSGNNINRKFLTLAYPGVRSQLFEVVVQGTVSIVRRPNLYGAVHIEDHNAYHYYIIDEQEHIIPLSEFRHLYSRLCKKSEGMLKLLVQAQRLNLTTRSGIISAILAYNSISSDNRKALEHSGGGQ
jgi:hypothetical protein